MLSTVFKLTLLPIILFTLFSVLSFGMEDPQIIPVETVNDLLNIETISSNTYVVLPSSVEAVWMEKTDFKGDFIAEKIDTYDALQTTYWPVVAIILFSKLIFKK